MMVDIKHDSEESLIDFDVIESNIREQEREIEREVAENAASKKVNMTVDDEYDQFMDEFDDHMHDEMGAYWKESSGELPEDSDDEFVSGWYTKGPTKKRITKARPAYTIKNRDHRDSNTSNDQIMLQIRKLHHRMDHLEDLLTDFGYVVDTVAEIREILIKMKPKK